ncbi:hypothetical protein L596_002148 [Steinernema carpocapsae]|uniref:G-protein coupled receptors family 1 profile domain-containing protein n=1 Tax=Steinernema carpocapsae TaxID=34508 RepID=A0A4U8UPE0_STECR|nr:hypothetical protein L596_002148 [Steinernema carpocapsae]
MTPTDVGLFARFGLYIGIGVFASVANILILVVLWSKKEMRTTLVLFQALAIADLVNGISYIISGASRRVSLVSGIFHDFIHPSDCIRAVYPSVLMLGGMFFLLNFLAATMEKCLETLRNTEFPSEVNNELVKSCVSAKAIYVYPLS